jgi:hypothetical protein
LTGLLSKTNKKSIANTDNMDKLFVTLFAGDVNASLAKNASGLSARTLFFFLIFYLHSGLCWHK